MRRKRIHKHTVPCKMKRRKKFNKNSNFMFDPKIRDSSVFNLETMNEFLRIYKTERAEGKGSWKLMPKDSCEVYKKRQQRETKYQSDSGDTETEKTEMRVQKRTRPRRQVGRKVKKTTGTQSKQKYKQRNNDSSVSFSSRTTTNSMSSFTSYSEMDCE